MSEQTQSKIEKKENSISSLLTYGEINLTLTLDLQTDFMERESLSWKNMRSLSELDFLKENESIWKKIQLSSTNKTVKLFLQLNKIQKQKTKIKFISFSKLKFNDQQSQYNEFLNNVINANGLYIDSYNICKNETSIQLRIRYNGKRKVFVLSGKRTPLDDDGDYDDDDDQYTKEDDNVLLAEGATKMREEEEPAEEEPEPEEESESDDDKIKNKLIKLSEEFYNPDQASFVYFCYDDYNSGKFKKISMEDLYEFFVYLKKNHKCRIILNLELETNDSEEFRDLLAVTDICIFYDKNNLFNILKKLKSEEDKIKKEQESFKHFYDDKIRQKHYKSLTKKNKMNETEVTINDTNKEEKKEENRYTKTSYSTNKICKLPPTNNKNKITKSLNKIEMFDYYKTGICDKAPIPIKTDKIIIVVDELAKVFFVEFNNNLQKPLVLDFDLQLYQKINVHNIKTIQEYKNLIKEKFEVYIFIFISYLLSNLISNGGAGDTNMEETSLFIGYYGACKILKKIIELDKNKKPIPKDNNFFYPDLNKDEINKLIEHATKKKKEYFFILDCNNLNEIKLKLYNPLLDKFIYSYVYSSQQKNFLKTNGFINHTGKILYDPVYRDSTGNTKNEKFVEDEEDLYKTCHDFKLNNNCKMKEKECLDRYKNINERQNKYLVGYKKKKPEYDIYRRTVLSNNCKLPLILQNTYKITDMNAKPKNKLKNNFRIKKLLK